MVLGPMANRRTQQAMSLPDVRPGQIWADNDPRQAGRTLRVVEITESRGPRGRYRREPAGEPIAIVEVATNSDHAQQMIDAGNPQWNDTRGKRGRIAVRRFKPTSTGYRLLSDAPEQTQV